MSRKPLVHHPIQAIAFIGIAIDGICNLLGRVHPKMMRLTRHRAEIADLPEQPFVDRHTCALLARVELADLAAEILQNRARFEYRYRSSAGAVRIDNGRHSI